MNSIWWNATSQATSPPRLRITSSMRFHLWIPLVINSYVFGWALSASLIDILLVSLCTCLTMSTSFVINDIVDRDIDLTNGKRRWVPSSTWDYFQVAFLSIVTVGAIAAASLFLPTPVIAVLAGALVLGIAYSFGPKRLPGIGNAIAALLIVSPAIAYFFLQRSPMQSPVNVELVQALVWAGYWTFFCREIRYDLFDREGDRRGGRATYAVVFGQRACNTLIALILVFATWTLVSAGDFDALASSPGMWGPVVGIYAALTAWSFSAKAEPAFTFRTRVFMSFWPVSLVISALL